MILEFFKDNWFECFVVGFLLFAIIEWFINKIRQDKMKERLEDLRSKV